MSYRRILGQVMGGHHSGCQEATRSSEGKEPPWKMGRSWGG